MSYELTLEQFENLNLFSNRNMEKVMAGVVNSSSNAALVNMGEDSVILLDHKKGDFYIADYTFDRKNLTLEFKDFEKIDLIQEDGNFEEDIKKVFESEDDDLDFSQLTESYKKNVVEKDNFLNELISYTMSRKPFNEDADYDALAEAVSESNINSKNKKFFEEYSERLKDHPLTEVKRFDWQNPVKVSLVETEKKKLVNKSAVEKAHELWKRPEFKEAFEEASSTFVEDVEQGTEEFKNLFEQYPQVYFLDAGDRRTLFGKTILSASNSLRESMDDLLKGIDLLFEKHELADIRERYLAEAEEGYEDEMDDDDEESEDDVTDAEEDDLPSEVEGNDVKNLVDDLTRIMNKMEDQKSKGKIEDLIDRLNKGMEEGTRPDLVKEAVAILSL